jgi:hypothetical protein
MANHKDPATRLPDGTRVVLRDQQRRQTIRDWRSGPMGDGEYLLSVSGWTNAGWIARIEAKKG